MYSGIAKTFACNHILFKVCTFYTKEIKFESHFQLHINKEQLWRIMNPKTFFNSYLIRSTDLTKGLRTHLEIKCYI